MSESESSSEHTPTIEGDAADVRPADVPQENDAGEETTSLVTVGVYAFIGAASLAALAVMSKAQRLSSSVVTELGETMAMASDWIGWVFTGGYIWILVIAYAAMRSNHQASRLSSQVSVVAGHGLSIDAAIQRVDAAKSEIVGASRNSAARAANFQILFGMLMTASWLALKAKVFVEAGGALASSSGGMGKIVSELLQLGPEAFVTTSAALATAVILTGQGLLVAASIRWVLPKDRQLVQTWRRAHEAWLDSERGAQISRTEELVAQAVATEQVEVLQQSFKSSMQAVGDLLGEVRISMSTLQDTASLMGSSYEKLEQVTAALETAQLNVTGVAESIEELTAKVEGYGSGLLEGTENFTERLVQDTSTRIPEVVSHATLKTVESMRPHLRSLTDEMHSDLAKSAESIERQYTRAFNDSLQLANTSLMRVNEMSEELESRSTLLAQTVGETAGRWAESIKDVASLHARLDEVSERSKAQIEQSIAAQTAMAEASQGTANMIRELTGLVEQARAEVGSIRQDAELLGQIREAVQQGGRR